MNLKKEYAKVVEKNRDTPPKKLVDNYEKTIREQGGIIMEKDKSPLEKGREIQIEKRNYYISYLINFGFFYFVLQAIVYGLVISIMWLNGYLDYMGEYVNLTIINSVGALAFCIAKLIFDIVSNKKERK